MPKEKIKVYLYTRVSTAMQIDGYSLETQKTKMKALVDNVQIYEERKENGQWLKSIEFKLPIIEKEFTLSLDNDAQNETVYLLSFSIEKCYTHQKRFQLRTELKPF